MLRHHRHIAIVAASALSALGPAQATAQELVPLDPTAGGTPSRIAPKDGLKVRDFAVRALSASVDGKGQVGIRLQLKNVVKAAKLVANGDWTVTVTDEDGLGFATRAIWMDGGGEPVPFHIMPNVAPGGAQVVRFVVKPEAAHARLKVLTVQQNGAAPVYFQLPPLETGQSPVKGPSPSKAAFAALKNLDVRLDHVAPVAGGRFELVFTARNRTSSLQYLGGSNLTFTAKDAAGQVVTNRRETFSLRGVPENPTGAAPVQPGMTARLRILFDRSLLQAPFTVTDGQMTAILPLPAAEEPEW